MLYKGQVWISHLKVNRKQVLRPSKTSSPPTHPAPTYPAMHFANFLILTVTALSGLVASAPTPDPKVCQWGEGIFATDIYAPFLVGFYKGIHFISREVSDVEKTVVARHGKVCGLVTVENLTLALSVNFQISDIETIQKLPGVAFVRHANTDPNERREVATPAMYTFIVRFDHRLSKTEIANFQAAVAKNGEFVNFLPIINGATVRWYKTLINELEQLDGVFMIRRIDKDSE
ncbi:hypothetical protein DFS34DRAFT_607777 [Phlyctochytrium arcticum]|nr:hypothetical protein DFS34DRAFT_607777 [Phlyctochytrium arcticum]